MTATAAQEGSIVNDVRGFRAEIDTTEDGIVYGHKIKKDGTASSQRIVILIAPTAADRG